MRAEILENLAALCEEGVDVICTNELAYPAYSSPACLALSDELCQRLADGDKTFRQDVQKLSDDHDCLILCGTHHDASDLHNKAMIFFPGDADSPREHIKLTSAKSINVGEVVRTPPNDEYIVYKTKFGEVAIFICLDAFDLNMFFRQVHLGVSSENRRDHTPDIIFVPAYTPQSLGKACEALSYFAASTVIYCNTNKGLHNGVYVGGKRVDKPQLGTSLRRVFVLTEEERKKRVQKAKENRRDGIILPIARTYGPPS
jgi:predicted amidohydrolase